MGIGIFFFVVGAILAFALQDGLVTFVDLNMVGYILMGAGFLTFIIGMAFMFKKRTSVTTNRTAIDPNTGSRVDQQESTSAF